jgi:hypothetical protein
MKSKKIYAHLLRLAQSVNLLTEEVKELDPLTEHKRRKKRDLLIAIEQMADALYQTNLRFNAYCQEEYIPPPLPPEATS